MYWTNLIITVGTFSISNQPQGGVGRKNQAGFILRDTLINNIKFLYSVTRKPNVLRFLCVLFRLNVSLDENCRLAYMEFLSALDQKAEKKDDPPPASPDAVRQIESLDSLSPGMAMARMRELVTTSAPNLQKVKLITTCFIFHHVCHQFLFQLILLLFLSSRHSWPLTGAGQGWLKLWNFVRCWIVFVPACQTNSTDIC